MTRNQSKMADNEESSALADASLPMKISSSERSESKDVKQTQLAVKVYKRRWLILALYIFHAALVSSQWIEYSIIANIVARYYSVSSFAVDCTSMIVMLFYGIFIFPIAYAGDRIGLRWTVIAGGALFCGGAWLKILSVSPDGFLLTMLGQSLAAVSVVILQTLPGRVAANWFASTELSTATSLGVFGPQLGVSLSFLLPPVLVKNREDLEDIGRDLSFMFWCVAIASSVNLLLLVFFFQEEPLLPPSETRALQKTSRGERRESFAKPMKRLLTNKNFLILCNSYGLNISILNAMGTLLNQLYLMHFEDGEEDAGRIGLFIIFTGMFGSISFGIILDKTHKFKETTVTVYFLTFCGQILFAIAMFVEIKWMVYTSSIFLGFFMSGYLALGYEMAAEYTFPESETNSAGILNITNNVYGVVLILILEQVLDHYGDVPVHVIFCVTLLVGLVMTVMTEDEQRRQEARIRYQDVPQHDDGRLSLVGDDIM